MIYANKMIIFPNKMFRVVGVKIKVGREIGTTHTFSFGLSIRFV